MKKALAGLFACVYMLLCLCACTFSASGDYYSESDHKSDEMLSNDNERSEIEDYYNLRSAMVNCVKKRKTSDTLIVKNYKGALQNDLEFISNEISNNLPMGLYAVKSFSYKQQEFQSRSEVYVEVSYTRSGIEMASVTKADNTMNFESDLSYAFASYQETEAFSFNNFDDEKEEFETRVLKCWLMAGINAMPIKEIEITNFPDYQKSRIIEMNIVYDEDLNMLSSRKRAISRHLDNVCRDKLDKSVESKISFVQTYVPAWTTRVDNRTEPLDIYSTTQADTAYGAFLGDGANQIGIAAATAAMCNKLGVDAEVMYGEKASNPYAWVFLRTDKMVIDVMGDSEQYLLPLETAKEIFSWNEKIYSF